MYGAVVPGNRNCSLLRPTQPTPPCQDAPPCAGVLPRLSDACARLCMCARAPGNPFAKYLNAYGILLTASSAGQDVKDNGLRWLATTVTEMFPATASDQALQATVLANLCRHTTAQAVFTGSFVDRFGLARDGMTMRPDHRLRPRVRQARPADHGGLLHTITNSGFPRTWPAL